ncbi:hypothetical protein Bbelb_249790 [Branchiostoma belcheri]|nr:hypothetical protein Bbelb_249790 [Branchiostoma belcheri]
MVVGKLLLAVFLFSGSCYARAQRDHGTARALVRSGEVPDEAGRGPGSEKTVTQEVLDREASLQAKVWTLTNRLLDEQDRSSQLQQNLTQALLKQESKFVSLLDSLTDQLSDEREKNRELEGSLAQVLNKLDSLATTLQAHGTTLKQAVQCSCEQSVATHTPTDPPTTDPPTDPPTTDPPTTDPTTTDPSTETPTTTTRRPTNWLRHSLDSDLRLVGGSGPHEGRVEVFHAGEWGTVCHSGWSLEDAHVACRQLGYPGADRPTFSAHFGRGTGRIWLDTLRCTGTEERLVDCERGDWGDVPLCAHIHDSGVVCKTSPGEPVTMSDLRLVGGSGPHEGRVEVFHAGEWGTVCHSGWSLEDAHVACRQLGYPEAVRETYSHGPDLAGHPGLYRDRATPHRLQARRLGVPWCRHIHDSGVVCKTAAAASLDEDDDDLI